MKKFFAVAALTPNLVSAVDLREIEDEVDDNLMKVGHFKGFTYTFHLRKKKWENAEQVCLAEGAELVSFHSSEELDFLLDFTDGKAFFTGLNDQANTGVWGWSDNSPVDFRTPWSANQPSDQDHRKCTLMTGENSSTPRQLRTFECNRDDYGDGEVQKKRFVCKRPTEEVPKFFFVDNAMTWHNARDYCSAYDMWLATLDSHAVMLEAKAVLMANILDTWDTQTWIGLNDIDEEGTYKWVQTGTETNYTNWYTNEDPPEPTNDWRGLGYLAENCVEMSFQGTWNDQLCTCDENLPADAYCMPEERPFLCQSQ